MDYAKEVWRRVSFVRALPSIKELKVPFTVDRISERLAALEGEDLRIRRTETSRWTLVKHAANKFQLAYSYGTDFPQVDHEVHGLSDLDLEDAWLASSSHFMMFPPNHIGIIRSRNGPSVADIQSFINRRAGSEIRKDFKRIDLLKLASVATAEEILEDMQAFQYLEVGIENRDNNLALFDGIPLDAQLNSMAEQSEPDKIRLILTGMNDNRKFDSYVRGLLEMWGSGAQFSKLLKKINVGGVNNSGMKTGYNLLKRYCEFRVKLPLKSEKSKALDAVAAFGAIEEHFREHRAHITSASTVNIKKRKKKSKDVVTPSLFA